MEVDTVQFKVAVGHIGLIDRADWESVCVFRHRDGYEKELRICDKAWRLKGAGNWKYVTCEVDSGKRRYIARLHRLIMQPPTHLVVDHINGNRLDNRRANLRICTVGENNRNSRPTAGTSGFKGVCFVASEGLWRAQISNGGRKMNLGRYTSEVEAARAYDAKAKEFFGEFAVLNFPTPETV